MARKSAIVRARMEPELKEEAEGILSRLGLSTAEAIRLFYHQVRLQRGLPFPVRVPNTETEAAIEDVRRRRNLERFETTDELFAAWDEEPPAG